MHIYARISKDQLPCCSVTAAGTTEGDGHAMVRQLHITHSILLNHRALRVTWNWFSYCPAKTQYVENRMEVRIEYNIKNIYLIRIFIEKEMHPPPSISPYFTYAFYHCVVSNNDRHSNYSFTYYFGIAYLCFLIIEHLSGRHLTCDSQYLCLLWNLNCGETVIQTWE